MITTLNIQGMHCGSCKMLIEEVCKDIEGVTYCIVDVANGTAKVEHEASVNPEAIQREIEGLGDYKTTIV